MNKDPHWYNPDIKPLARNLRRNMTPEERHLWYDFLKNLPFAVKRQRVIQNYIADFYIPAAKTVIELDGSQHYSEEGLASDSVRNAAMGQLGITVLRHSNADIDHRFESVCEDIRNRLLKSLPQAGKVAPKATDEGTD